MIAEKINDLQAQPSQPSLPLRAASPLPKVSAGKVAKKLDKEETSSPMTSRRCIYVTKDNIDYYRKLKVLGFIVYCACCDGELFFARSPILKMLGLYPIKDQALSKFVESHTYYIDKISPLSSVAKLYLNESAMLELVRHIPKTFIEKARREIRDNIGNLILRAKAKPNNLDSLFNKKSPSMKNISSDIGSFFESDEQPPERAEIHPAEKKIYDYAEKVTARQNSSAKPPTPTDLPPEEWQRYIDRQINKKFRRLLMQMIIKLEEDERSSK